MPTIELKHEGQVVRFSTKRIVRGENASPNWLASLPARPIADFWQWLETHYPGNPYDVDDDNTVRIEHDIYHLRNAVFQQFVNRGTAEACLIMQEIMMKRPDQFWLGDVLAQMRRSLHRNAWSSSQPESILEVINAPKRRLVRTAGDLHELVIESLGRFEEELHGAPPSTELWNEFTEGRAKSQFWSPKSEKNLSNCLKRFLERALNDRGVLASREVEIRPHIGEDQAQLVDLLVTATPFDFEGRPAPPVKVVVELKCGWNRGLLDDICAQLYNRYLNNSELNFGIYVVGYFLCPSWNHPNDHAKRQAHSQKDLAELRSELEASAAQLTNSHKRVNSIVLDARLSLQPSRTLDLKDKGAPSQRRVRGPARL